MQQRSMIASHSPCWAGQAPCLSRAGILEELGPKNFSPPIPYLREQRQKKRSDTGAQVTLPLTSVVLVSM